MTTTGSLSSIPLSSIIEDTIKCRTKVVRGITLRPAKLADEYEVLALGKRMHEESVYSRIKWSTKKTFNLFRNCVMRADHVGIVAERDGVVLGMLGAYISEYSFSEERLAQDVLFYVEPTARGGFAASEMIKLYKDWAQRNKVRDIVLGASALMNNSRTFKLLAHLGFDEGGRVYKIKVA